MKTGQFVVFVKNAEILRRQTDLFNCNYHSTSRNGPFIEHDRQNLAKFAKANRAE